MHTLSFLRTMHIASRTPLYYHMWQPLCNLFSGTLLNEPCSPKLHLKLTQTQITAPMTEDESGHYEPDLVGSDQDNGVNRTRT